MATILVVDDRPTNREYLVTLLGYAGHRLLEASDGAEALGIVRAERVDLVITDILMPTMDGYEFASRLRADTALAEMPVIFYTATYLEREARALAQAASVPYVISKPAEPQAILNIVNTALGLTQPPALPPAPDAFKRGPLDRLAEHLVQKEARLDVLSMQLAALIELGLELGLEREPERLLEKFCHGARDIIGAKYAALGVLADDGKALRHFLTSGLDAERIARIGSPPVVEGLLGRVLAERRPVRVRDIAAEPTAVGFPPHHPPLRSFLGVPIATPTQLHGLLYLADKLGADEFGDEDERVAAALGAQVGVAYENARRYDEIQRHAADLEREIVQRRRVETQLSRAELKYRTLVEQIPAVAYTAALDQFGTTLYISPQIESMLGFTAAEWTFDPDLWRNRLHPDDRERVVAEVARSRAAGEPLRSEYRLLHRDGRVVWVRDEATVVRSDVGRPLFLQGIVLDIGERKQAEVELRESEARKGVILESALDCIISIDHEGKIIEFNPAAEKTFGYTRDEVLGKELAETVIPPSMRQAHRRGLAHYLATGEGPVLGKRIEISALRADGAEFPVELAITPIRLESRLIFTAYLRDITERKRAEEALQERESQLSLVYSNVSDIIFYLAVERDGRFRFLSVNLAFLKATGLTESQVVGKLVQEVIPEPAHALVLGNYEEAIRDKKTVTWEEVSVYPAGTKHGEVSVTPIFDANGHCTNLIGTVHDITERKQAEEEIRQLNAELEQRVLERTAQLEAANQELEAFSYSVSHDLRAPLRAVIGFAGAVLEDYAERLDADGRRYLTTIHDSAKNLGQLIDDLLTLSRLGRQQMTLSEIDMTALVRSVAEELQQAMPERALQFVIPPLPAACGDHALIRQVWVNLLSNGVKFTRARDQAVIEVGGQAGASENVYVVRDNGVGFDNRYVDKLFGVFQRLHRADEFEGTGIGLSIVRRVIHRHGGQVRAEGQVERGAAFYFTLPVQETKDEHDL